MSQYIHHVPGRLRIKTLLLKRNEGRATEVCKLLACTEGVLDCEVKTVTGSIVISYDANKTDSNKLVTLLHDHGFITAIMPVEKAQVNGQMARTMSTATENVGKALVGFVVERSAVALIGAIL